MEDKVYRYHYRAALKEGADGRLDEKIREIEKNIAALMEEGRVMTACLYRYKDMLFAYYESIGEELAPQQVYGPMGELLELWPGEDGSRDWVYMYHVYYHAIPEGVKDWKRKAEPAMRRGIIAYLKPDKIFQYVYHHVAITTEGYLHGDKYQSIALHENILFSYFEEPRTEINVKRDLTKQSTAIEAWSAVDPESHFMRKEGQQGNFFFIPALIAMG